MPDISEEFVGTCIIAYWFCKCYIKRRNFLKVRLYKILVMYLKKNPLFLQARTQAIYQPESFLQDIRVTFQIAQ